MAGKAGAIRAGRAFVELFADDSALQRGLKRAQARLRAFGDAVTSVGKKLAGIGTAGIAALGAAAKVFADAGDTLHKMSIRTGISVEALSQLGFAAEQSGSNLDELANAVLRMNRRLGRITAGQASKTQEEALKALGLGAEELERLSPEERLFAIADAMAAMSDKAEAAGLAQRAFGTQVDKILPLLLEGREGMEALMREADQLGLTMSQDQADAAAALTDAWNRITRQFKQVVIQIGGAVAPAITDLADRITPVVKGVIDWIRGNSGLITTVGGVAAVVAGAGGALILLGGAFKLAAVAAGLAATATSGVGAALGVLTSPISLAVAAVAGLGAVIATQTEAGAQAVEFLKSTFGPLAETATAAFGAIRDALASGDIGKAAEILWSTLKLAFVGGITFLKTKWIDLKATLLGAFVDLWSKLPEGWRTAIRSMISGFISFGNQVRSIWRAAQNAIAKGFLHIMKLFDESIDVAAASENLDREFQRDIARFDRQAAQAKQNLEQQLDRFAEDPEAAKADIQQQAQAERSKLQADLRKAKRELDQLIKEGQETPALEKPETRRKQQQARQGAAGLSAGGPGGLASVQATSQQGLKIIAEALRRGRGRDPQEQTARNTKQMVEEQRQTREALERGRPAVRSIGNS